jgi:hypothetical protein
MPMADQPDLRLSEFETDESELIDERLSLRAPKKSSSHLFRPRALNFKNITHNQYVVAGMIRLPKEPPGH